MGGWEISRRGVGGLMKASIKRKYVVMGIREGEA